MDFLIKKRVHTQSSTILAFLKFFLLTHTLLIYIIHILYIFLTLNILIIKL